MKLSRVARLSLVALVAPVLAAQAPLEAFTDSLPGLRVSWEMVPVPGGTVTLPDGQVTEVAPFWIGRTEVPWELYDIFYLRFDVPRAQRAAVDATSRPSRPYGAPDRGFGHRGYPAISLTHRAAVDFAAWLSAKTGHRYAVATDAQWQRAADLAFPDPGAPAAEGVAWTSRNATGTTHPVATLAPDALGLHDLLGNAGEWVTGMDGTPWLRGGSFETRPDSLDTRARARQRPAWNQTDPQVPKSRWWLSDGPFAGLRLVRIP
ncbi:MAG: SUMF1/EgtB/PvdO family nonheme iron enzyme [Gemmatimonadales bacterium]|nr:SUMF1/EgtB/PvdO family nonheme iron enzyme [Gemmatimonadales bacterium]